MTHPCNLCNLWQPFYQKTKLLPVCGVPIGQA
jgi:hypothetical protein